MSRIELLELLYSDSKSASEFSFDNLHARPLLSLLTTRDIDELRKIATSIRLSSKPEQKYKLIDNILTPRGFKLLSSGTNRVVYKYLEDQSIVIKVAIDKVGMGDSPREYYNQFLLQPFVTKVFEVSPCGTVGLFERVSPITSREEYLTVIDDVYSMLTSQIIGKFVAEDIGSKYFQNIGIRSGFGVVLLDFPYVYELDGNKLYCNKPDLITKIPCGGEIDYDNGLNNLICTKCGKRYYARELSSMVNEKKIICRKKGGELNMKIAIRKGNDIIKELNPKKEVDVIPMSNKNNGIKVINPRKVYPKQQENKEVSEKELNANMCTNDYKNNISDVFVQAEDKESEQITHDTEWIDITKDESNDTKAEDEKVSDNY